MAEAGRATAGSRELAVIAAGVMFMENLDATVIATALPAIARDVGVATNTLSLGISAYLLGNAITIPLGGWLADRWGERRLLCAAIALFTLVSLLCGACSDFRLFVALRLLQGAAAALMTPVARLAVMRQASPAELMQAVAIMTWPALIAPVVGPPLGGLLADQASWRWIFFVNLPIGLLGIAMAWRRVPDAAQPRPRLPFDGAGFALLGTALCALILGLELAGNDRGAWAIAAPLVAAGVVLGTAALRRARSHPHPLFALGAGGVRTFAVANLGGGFLSRLAIGAMPFLLPLLFQLGLGMSAAASGTLLLAYFAGNIGMKVFTTRILRRCGFRRVLLGNGLLLAATVAAAALIRPGWPTAALAALLVAAGCARSLQMTALNSLSFADLPPGDRSSANVLAGVAQQLALTASVTIASLLLGAGLAARGVATPAAPDFAWAFLGVALLTAAACLSYARLPADAGAAVSGQAPRTRPA